MKSISLYNLVFFDKSTRNLIWHWGDIFLIPRNLAVMKLMRSQWDYGQREEDELNFKNHSCIVLGGWIQGVCPRVKQSTLGDGKISQAWTCAGHLPIFSQAQVPFPPLFYVCTHSIAASSNHHPFNCGSIISLLSPGSPFHTWGRRSGDLRSLKDSKGSKSDIKYIVLSCVTFGNNLAPALSAS